jgi:hypothetical protein
MNPSLTQALAAEHLRELDRQRARAGHRGVRRPGHRSARQAAGWLLVGLGLRLAVPRRPLTAPAG